MLHHFVLESLLFAVALFCALMVCLEIGHRIHRRNARAGKTRNTSSVDAAVFALLGLLIAFTFSSAAQRFDQRRTLIVEEANAIGTAYLRLALLPPEARRDLEERLRRYVDARLVAYRAMATGADPARELEAANQMQRQIWDRAVVAAAGTVPASTLLLPALNGMFDIATTRAMAAKTHPPLLIFVMLFVLAVLASLLAGFAMSAQERPWLHSIVYSVALSAAAYVIVDMEFPRFGVIRIDSFDSVLVDTLKGLK